MQYPYLKTLNFIWVGLYDAAIHVGDMAYDMAELDGHRGDVFMEQIEPIASMVGSRLRVRVRFF